MSFSENILSSWQANAENWIQTIDHQEIESRTLVTNQAIINAVVQCRPQTVLDVGCGEGWLTHALSVLGMNVTGVDAIPALIANAEAKGQGHFFTATYEQIANDEVWNQPIFDAVVINFALIDQTATEKLLHFLPQIMRPAAHLIIQTLHPLSLMDEIPYQSGWKSGSWNSMKRNFVQPYDWYFRTISDWIRLLKEAHLPLIELMEPLHPKTQQPASMILIGTRFTLSDVG
jgi:2-polyprenyl-3-methyl-5-hydroxy-6-metoxy-1,4-benzoquinol methylase